MLPAVLAAPNTPFAQLKVRGDRVKATFQEAARTHEMLKAECQWLRSTIKRPELDEAEAVLVLGYALVAVSAVGSMISSHGCNASDREALETGLRRLHDSLVTVGICEHANRYNNRLAPPEPHHVSKARMTAPGDELASLTRRERQVLKFIVDGCSTKQVAAALGISFKTAACHRYRLMDKLDIHDTVSLVRYAMHTGLC